MFPLIKIITSHTKHFHTTQRTTTPSGNKAIKFSTGVSEAHEAAEVKGPEAANLDNCVNLQFDMKHGIFTSLLLFCSFDTSARVNM